MEELSFADYWAILKRRQKTFFIVASIVFAFSCVFAANWSNYRSEATVEIAQPDIDTTTTNPNEITSIADLRISRVQQKVLSIGSLAEIIRKYNLYNAKNAGAPIAKLAKKMHSKINISLLGGKIANPASANKATARQLSAIAFTLSFDYSDPETAQVVTNELVNRFLNEDNKEQQDQAQQTSSFLSSQIKLLEDSLIEQEKKMTDFRMKHGDISPESLSFDKHTAASIDLRLQNIEAQITTNLGAQGTLRAQLATTNPYSRTMADGQILTTPTIQLKALESEYATLTAKYSEQHPDVVKIKRQIEALKPLVEGTSMHATLLAKIQDAQTRLNTSLKTNGKDHPDVKKLETELAAYKQNLEKLPTHENPNSVIKKDADNPTYLQISAQLQGMEMQYKALTAQKETILQQQQEYNQKVANSPAIEQQFTALSRDYENILERYRELNEKKLQSEMKEEIAKGRTGERLVLTNPPELPLTTHPGRFLFILAGMVVAASTGFASIFILHLLSDAVVGPRHLFALAGSEPLVCIPHIDTELEQKKKASWLKSFGALFNRLNRKSL